jgi:hypothetical protein
MNNKPDIAGFSIGQWSAWAPGLSTEAQWRQWFDTRQRTGDDTAPRLEEMSAMMRRRARALGRAALQCTYYTKPASPDSALIFASRYGEMSRTLDLLRQLASGETLSPADFSMSVHNAIGALYSIAEGHTGQYSAIAAGEETLEAAFTEACTMLATEHQEVIVIHYDDSLPSPLQEFDSRTWFPRACAWRLQRSNNPQFSLTPQEASGQALAPELPPDLAVLGFMLSDATTYDHNCSSQCWRWKRHAPHC